MDLASRTYTNRDFHLVFNFIKETRVESLKFKLPVEQGWTRKIFWREELTAGFMN